MNPKIDTRMVKAGKRTYFFDVKEASNGKKFLQITESRIVGPKPETPGTQGQDRERSVIIVFPEDIAEFIAAFNETAKLVKLLPGPPAFPKVKPTP